LMPRICEEDPNMTPGRCRLSTRYPRVRVGSSELLPVICNASIVMPVCNSASR
jgi:hypothetical protein